MGERNSTYQFAFMILADSTSDIFGKINPPPGLSQFGTDPTTSLANLMSVGLKLFFIVAGLFMLVYLLLGGFEWITSGGEKEKVASAQTRMQNFYVAQTFMPGFATASRSFPAPFTGLPRISGLSP